MREHERITALRDLYAVGTPVDLIAQILGVTHHWVYSRKRAAGIPDRPKQNPGASVVRGLAELYPHYRVVRWLRSKGGGNA